MTTIVLVAAYRTVIVLSILCHNVDITFGKPVARTTYIPHVLHTVQILDDNTAPTHNIPPSWMQSCLLHHPHWQRHFWDRPAAEEFLQDHYPWFYDTWNNYSSPVQRSDALRPLILNHYGGLYLDSDIQCFRDVEPFLRNHTLVLQGDKGDQLRIDDKDAWVPKISNSVGASVVGHPFWQVVMTLLVERANNQDPLFSTGPTAWSDALVTYVKAEGRMQKPLRDTVKLYPVNTFFFPCFFNFQCDVDMSRNLVLGNVSPLLAGFHRFLGSWTANGKHEIHIPPEVCV